MATWILRKCDLILKETNPIGTWGERQRQNDEQETNSYCVVKFFPPLTHTLLVANYVDCSINSAWGKACEVECVVSNSLMSWKKATAELNWRLKWNTGQSGSLAAANS